MKEFGEDNLFIKIHTKNFLPILSSHELTTAIYKFIIYTQLNTLSLPIFDGIPLTTQFMDIKKIQFPLILCKKCVN